MKKLNLFFFIKIGFLKEKPLLRVSIQGLFLSDRSSLHLEYNMRLDNSVVSKKLWPIQSFFYSELINILNH